MGRQELRGTNVEDEISECVELFLSTGQTMFIDDPSSVEYVMSKERVGNFLRYRLSFDNPTRVSVAYGPYSTSILIRP